MVVQNLRCILCDLVGIPHLHVVVMVISCWMVSTALMLPEYVHEPVLW